MAILAKYTNCSTSELRNVDLQLIAQMQRIAPGRLIKVEHPKIVIGAGCHPYLQTPAAKALVKAINRRGVQSVWNSGYRTLPQQGALFNHFQNRRCGITAAARPGASNHNSGLAIDVTDPYGWKPYLEDEEFDWLGSWDEWHFDYKGPGCIDLTFVSIKAYQQLWNFNHPNSRIAEDGKWGIQTMNALRNCPIAGFARVPGEVKTNVLKEEAVAQLQGEPLPLRKGMSGELVKKLQKALGTAGYAIAADGEFGEQTASTVKQYQTSRGLTADGVVGRQTWRSLLA